MNSSGPNTTTLSKEWFSARVEQIVINDRLPYMDAVLDLCETYEMEPALAASLITESIEQHIKSEALDLNMYKEPSDSLPGV